MQDPGPPVPVFTAHAHPARALRVIVGAALGDSLADSDGLEGDVYRLQPGNRARPLRLDAATAQEGGQRIAEGSAFGATGDSLGLLRLLTLIGSDGDRVEILLTRLGSGERLVIPLTPLAPRGDYTLISAAPPPPGIRIADLACAAFARGTRITRGDGHLCPIETLRPGDEVLTRDGGAQKVRWIGRATLRADGAFAPVVIRAGTLGNLADLTLSPHARIFVYQRGADRIGARAELLVEARHLVNGDSVRLREGGHVDYHSLILDRHEIVYAEGVPVESLMVDPVSLPLLPDTISQDLIARFPGLSQARHFARDPPDEAIPALRDRLLGG